MTVKKKTTTRRKTTASKATKKGVTITLIYPSKEDLIRAKEKLVKKFYALDVRLYRKMHGLSRDKYIEEM